MIKKYGVLAYPANHSLSPVMHNAAFRHLGIDANYEVFEVPEMRLCPFIHDVRTMPIDGLSVSLPYKEEILMYLDGIEKNAKNIGAVNTIINNKGFLYGCNTDYLASNKALFLEAENYIVPKKDAIAVVIGAGGAARAVCYGLLKFGIHVLIANRTKSKADRIAMEFAEFFDKAEIHSVPYSDPCTGDILVNTTSIWLKNPKIKELPYFCQSKYLKQFGLIMDIVYKPLETPLIKAAKKLGKPYVTGEKMLLYQAADQFELFMDKEAPVEIMRKALEKALGRND